jgi:long-chain fatty acid transport protein
MNTRVAVAAMVVAVALSSVAFFGREARAAGIALDVQSGRGTAMAGAVTAMIDDSSAIFYNPAGIARGKVFDAQVGDTLIIPSFKYTSPSGASTGTSPEVVAPFQAYESVGITDNISIGVGVFTPFGLTVAWPSDWAGKSLIRRAALATYDFNPTEAVRIGPLRIGAGLQIVRATVDLQRAIVAGATTASSELGAAAWSVGANVGAQLDVVPKYLSLGVHYRSAVKFSFDGRAHIDKVPVELQSLLHDQRAMTSITTPDILQMGVATRPTQSLTIDLDIVWNGWSKFRSIDITFPNDSSGGLGTTQPKNWNNTVNAHIGWEAALGDSWRLRGGVLYDPTPSPASTLTPDVPDANRVNLALGGGYLHSSGLRFDVGYQFIFALKTTSTVRQLPGDYSGTVNVIGLSLGYRTPAR